MCGFCQTNSVTVPSSRIWWSLSNIAKEWCAAAMPVSRARQIVAKSERSFTRLPSSRHSVCGTPTAPDCSQRSMAAIEGHAEQLAFLPYAHPQPSVPGLAHRHTLHLILRYLGGVDLKYAVPSRNAGSPSRSKTAHSLPI